MLCCAVQGPGDVLLILPPPSLTEGQGEYVDRRVVLAMVPKGNTSMANPSHHPQPHLDGIS